MSTESSSILQFFVFDRLMEDDKLTGDRHGPFVPSVVKANRMRAAAVSPSILTSTRLCRPYGLLLSPAEACELLLRPAKVTSEFSNGCRRRRRQRTGHSVGQSRAPWLLTTRTATRKSCLNLASDVGVVVIVERRHEACGTSLGRPTTVSGTGSACLPRDRRALQTFAADILGVLSVSLTQW